MEISTAYQTPFYIVSSPTIRFLLHGVGIICDAFGFLPSFNRIRWKNTSKPTWFFLLLICILDFVLDRMHFGNAKIKRILFCIALVFHYLCGVDYENIT